MAGGSGEIKIYKFNPSEVEQLTVSSTAASTTTLMFELKGFTTQPLRHERPPEDHLIYPLVGRVASEWAHLERLLDLIIADLGPLPSPRMACITAQLMGIWPRINSILALLAQRSVLEPKLQDYIKRFRALGNDSRDASERRNRIIHDPWYVDKETAETAQQKSMPKDDKNYRLQYGIKQVDRKEIDELLGEIKKITDTVSQLKSEILESLKP
jgi:hypothetical protein